MALKGAVGAVSASGMSGPEKRKAAKGKKDRPKVQSAWLAIISKTRERYPISSFHLRISLTDGISRPRLGRWSVPRRHDNIEVVRTKSQAGMLRPRRFPTVYKSNSRLFIDPCEHPVPERHRAKSEQSDSEKHSVIVNLPERVGMQIVPPSPEKHSVAEDIPNTLEIILSARIQQVQQAPSRFEELNDDATVHELEAVYPTASTPAEDFQAPTAVILCEADDPTALPTLEFVQRSFTMDIKQQRRQRRPKISLSIPRSKSLHNFLESSTSGTAFVTSPLSPPSSTSLYRSLTQLPTMQYSIISPLTPIDMPIPVRPYSTISVPLFMEASDLAHATEAVSPLSISIAAIAGKDHATSNTEPTIPPQEPSARIPGKSQTRSGPQEDKAFASSRSLSDDTDDADEEDPLRGMTGKMTKKTMAASINKPLPPEPQLAIPAMLRSLAYKPRPSDFPQGQETLPRSRYSPSHTGRFDDHKRFASVRSPSLDQAIEELEWRLSTICERRSDSDGPRARTPIQVSRGSISMQPARSTPPVPQNADSEAVRKPSQPIVRSNSASHIIFQAREVHQKRTRSCHHLTWPRGASELGDLSMVEESETWYRTASERSSADLSHSVFSDAGTDGTSQTEQSNAQEKVKEKAEVGTEKECLVNNIELSQAVQFSQMPTEVPETVILRIMSNLMTLKDLFATAALSKGFYNTFKRHEMYLIKATLFRSSVAAWELREISDEGEINPTAYLRQYSVEIYTTGMLKSLILVQCESFLRPATIAGLVGADQVRSGEIDAAFWRVWTFCRLFGSTAGNDEDLEAQADWLNGGHYARQQDPSSPFGIGNGKGLSKSELYDMSELWTCLSVLVQTFHGRIGEARAAGIYEQCRIDASRDEELLLEEWTWYLLTLGPSCILALAPGSFATAKNLGLTHWSPPAPGSGSSRSKFFKDALKQAYEERLADEIKAKGGKGGASKASHRSTKSEMARDVDRARQTAFAHELRSQRAHSPSKSEPWTFSDERPMSVYSEVVKSLPQGASRVSAQGLPVLPELSPKRRASRPNSILNKETKSPHPQSPVLTSASAVPSAEDNLPVSYTGLPMTASPTISTEENSKGNSIIVDPIDRAMSHLIDVLGFGKDEAKWALTRSENGHGVDVEKAVDMLLHGSPPNSRASSRQGASSPVEVESLTARPKPIRKKTPVWILQQRDSIVTTDEMTEKEKERANKMRMREKSYRVLGIGTPQAGRRFGSMLGRRLGVR